MARRPPPRSSHAGRNLLFRPRQKTGRVGRWIVVAAAILVPIGGYTALALWPRFHVQDISVQASASLSTTRIQSFVAQRLSGTTLGLPKHSEFVLSTGSIARDLRKALGSTVTLQTLVVRRRWPTGLIVVLKEASGAYVLKSGTDALLLDPSGTVVNRIPADTSGLFVLTDPSALSWVVGEKPVSSDTLTGLSAFRMALLGMGVTVVSATLSEASCFPEVTVDADPSTNSGATNAAQDNTASPVLGGVNDPSDCDPKELVRINPDLTLVTSEGWVLTVTVTGDRDRQLRDLTQVLAARTGPTRSALKSVDVRLPGRAYLR